MNNQNGQSGNKAIVGLFVLAIVVVIGIVMFMRVSNRGNIVDQVSSGAESGRQMDSRLADFRALKALIIDKNVDVAIVEKSLDDFGTNYGERLTETTELRLLLDKRKNAELQAAELEGEIASNANEIKRLIQNSKMSFEYLESAISEFGTSFGEDRQESRELRRLLIERKIHDEKIESQEKAIVLRAKELIARINDDNEALKSIRSAVSEFVIDYGDDRKEVPELRRLLEERKKFSQKELSREEMISEEAKKLTSRINNKDENLKKIESALSEFVIRYGKDRKELPGLRRLVRERREAEHKKSLMATEVEKIRSRIKDRKHTIQDLEQSISEFIGNFGEDHEVVVEFNRLLDVRREEEKRNKAIANDLALLKSQIGDYTYSMKKLHKDFYKFINTYGKDREEVPELQRLLEERKKTELDLRGSMSKEVRNLMRKVKDRTYTIDSLEGTIDHFILEYGNNHKVTSKLQRRLDDRRSEEAIADLLSALDSSVETGNVSKIRSMVSDKKYANRLIALTEWPNLLFRHHIQSFQHDDDGVDIRVEINHAANYMPQSKLYYRYHLLKDLDGWKIKTSEKVKN